MKTSIFQFDDYKDYLNTRINNSDVKHGLISRLAEAASCQRSYLSQVLNGHVQLTSDHALGLCHYFRFNDKETDYFLNLVDLSRAGSLRLKDRLRSKIERMQKDYFNLSKRVDAKAITISSPEAFYYSSWHWMAIHIATSVPEFNTVEAISERLNLPLELVKKTLNQLLDMGYVEKKKDKWSYAGSNLHLSNESPSVVVHHTNWRQRSAIDSAMPSDNSIHYTSVFSLSHRDYQFLKERILEWIDESRAIIGPSPSEEVVCFCVDFFKA
ncbi:MAG: TIGR02147 family protein [Pseudobdellovibrionaceae bacterium]